MNWAELACLLLFIAYLIWENHQLKDRANRLESALYPRTAPKTQPKPLPPAKAPMLKPVRTCLECGTGHTESVCPNCKTPTPPPQLRTGWKGFSRIKRELEKEA